MPAEKIAVQIIENGAVIRRIHLVYPVILAFLPLPEHLCILRGDLSEIQLAGLQLQRPGLGILHNFKDDLIDFGLAAVILLVLSQGDTLPHIPLFQAIGPGAHGILVEGIQLSLIPTYDNLIRETHARASITI